MNSKKQFVDDGPTREQWERSSRMWAENARQHRESAEALRATLDSADHRCEKAVAGAYVRAMRRAFLCEQMARQESVEA